MKKARGPLSAAQPGAARLALVALGLINTAVGRNRRPAGERGEDLHTVRENVARVIECLDKQSGKLKRKSREVGEAIFDQKEV